jgi:hypothetical protein
VLVADINDDAADDGRLHLQTAAQERERSLRVVQPSRADLRSATPSAFPRMHPSRAKSAWPRRYLLGKEKSQICAACAGLGSLAVEEPAPARRGRGSAQASGCPLHHHSMHSGHQSQQRLTCCHQEHHSALQHATPQG